MYAGFWKRVAAYLIDCVLVGVVNYILFFIMFAIGKQMSVSENSVFLFSGVIIAGFYLLYYVYAEASLWQATVGKRIVGIKVTDEYGHRISFWRSLGRYIAMAVSSVSFLIGYMMCGWTERKQCLHDKIAGCLVVDKNYVIGQQPAPAPHKIPWWAIVLCCIPAGMFLLGLLAALFLPAMIKKTEEARSKVQTKMIVIVMRQVASVQSIHNLKTGQYTTQWDDLLGEIITPLPDVAYVNGSQNFNPNHSYESGDSKKLWVLVLGPEEITAWRTPEGKYRIVMPYKTKIPQCLTDDTQMRTFCDEFNSSQGTNAGHNKRT